MKTKLIEKLREKVKDDKKIVLIVIVGLLGMLLVFASELFEKTPKEKVTASEPTQSYESLVEERLKTLIESIDGVGTAEVMVVFDSSRESVYAKDTDENFEKNETGNSNRVKSDYVLVENDGEKSGLLTKSVYPKVGGVAVVCDGAADSVIKQRIVETVSALFDINSTQISVVRKSG